MPRGQSHGVGVVAGQGPELGAKGLDPAGQRGAHQRVALRFRGRRCGIEPDSLRRCRHQGRGLNRGPSQSRKSRNQTRLVEVHVALDPEISFWLSGIESAHKKTQAGPGLWSLYSGADGET
jgi:hypothetical protein